MVTSLKKIINQEEISLVDKDLNNYIKEINKYPSLSFEQEQTLAQKASEGSLEAKQELTRANLKLVVAIAKKSVHSSNLPMIDLIQEGNLGLMVAIDKFNWKFGYRFATYASWWIKQSIFKAISEQSHSMKIPVYIQETLSKYSKIKSDMEKKSNIAISIEDVAKKMNIEVNKIDAYLNAYNKTLSLDAAIEMNGNNEVYLSDIIEDKKASAQADVEYVALQKDIKQMLGWLKEREQTVIRFRFGIGEAEKKTLDEIGKLYGVTKECIRQTEARALKKLRSNSLGAMLYNAYVV